jgi:transcriptional regulator with XRE-family HTH domain
MPLMIRHLRKSRGWSQLELATRAGFDRVATISDLETGKTVNPQISTLQQIADAFGVTLRDLFSGTAEPDEIEQMLDDLGRLSPADRAVVRGLIERLLDR